MRKIKNKIILAIIIIALLLANFNFSYGNLEDNEIVDIQKVKEEVIPTVQTESSTPKINSRIGVIYDRNSGRILYGKNENKQTPMASTTKIMTAIVVIENANLNDVVTIDAKSAGTGGSRLGLQKNDKITVHDLLYGLMLCSGNDDAVS